MLGDLLRETREKQNLTVDAVEKGTNIRKLYILALEENDYSKLPKAEVFVKGFIKSYGKFLGLETEPLIQQYMNEKGLSANTPVDIEIIEEKQEEKTNSIKVKAVKNNSYKASSNRTKLSDLDVHKEYMQTKSFNKKYLVGIICVIIVLLGIIIYGISALTSSSNSSDSNPSTPPAAVEKQQEIKLQATFEEDTYTVVTVDGKEVLAKSVNKGETLSWTGKSSIKILAADPQVVKLTLNGKDIGVLADSNKETSKVFTIGAQGNITQEEVPVTVKAEPKTEEPKESVEETKKEEAPTPAPVKVEKPKPKPQAKVEPKVAPAPAPAKAPAAETPAPAKQETSTKKE